MAELGQLEANWQDFEKRNVRVIVISVEDRDKAAATQADFPHLIVVADAGRKLAEAVAVLDPASGPGEGEAVMPTTILTDRRGRVRGVLRPDRVVTRLSPSEVLAAIDREMPAD